MPEKRITRRDFLLGAASVLGGLTLAEVFQIIGKAQPSGKLFFPLATHNGPGSEEVQPPAGDGRVVHVRAVNASDWDGGASAPVQLFFDHVDQSVVDSIAEKGLRLLYDPSGTATDGWDTIWNKWFTRVRTSGYVAGATKIAIKVNFNAMEFFRGMDCSHQYNLIDALPHPIIGLIKTMNQAGVRNDDITLFDATLSHNNNGQPHAGRRIPTYFHSKLSTACPGVHFVGDPMCGSGVTAPTYGKSEVSFNQIHAAGLLPRKLADVLADAAFVVNVPILKAHSGDSGVPFSAGFKNHLGSVEYVNGGTNADSIHHYIAPSDPLYRPQHNPLVEIYRHPNIADKTVMVLGDGIFGSTDGAGATGRWSDSTFGGPAHSLFFSLDPVAMDCILADIVRKEGSFTRNDAYDYLFLAQEAGLGKMEGTRANPGNRDPFHTPYQALNYIRAEL